MDKANAFRNYFHSVFTVDNCTLPTFLLRTDNNMVSFTFSFEEVRNVLKTSGSSYTISPDGFPAYLLSKLAGELTEQLTRYLTCL